MGEKAQAAFYIENLNVFTEKVSLKRTASYFRLESCKSGLLYDSA